MIKWSKFQSKMHRIYFYTFAVKLSQKIPETMTFRLNQKHNCDSWQKKISVVKSLKLFPYWISNGYRIASPLCPSLSGFSEERLWLNSGGARGALSANSSHLIITERRHLKQQSAFPNYSALFELICDARICLVDEGLQMIWSLIRYIQRTHFNRCHFRLIVCFHHQHSTRWFKSTLRGRRIRTLMIAKHWRTWNHSRCKIQEACNKLDFLCLRLIQFEHT
jgi:hypothetical protein